MLNSNFQVLGLLKSINFPRLLKLLDIKKKSESIDVLLFNCLGELV